MSRGTKLLAAASLIGIPIIWALLRATGFFEDPNKATNNDYARITCRDFVHLVQSKGESGSWRFDTTLLTPEDWTVLVRASRSWHKGVDFFVRTNFGIPEPKQVVIVCNTEYETTWPTIRHLFKRNPAYAVGYSDGSVGFIQRDQYLAIERAGLVPLSILVSSCDAAKTK